MSLDEPKKVDCILLGAGASRRMAEPKLLLPLGEKTIFEIGLASHLASGLRSICAVVAGWLPGFKDIARRCEDKRLKFLEMARPGGMSDSLKAGWQWVQRAWAPHGIMISLADKPLVTARTIDLMVAAFVAGGHDICVPVYAGQWGHPVVLSTDLSPEIMALDGDKGAIEILERHRDSIHEVQVESDGIIFDIDSAEDMVELKMRLGLNG